jgi:hypothetical protein
MAPRSSTTDTPSPARSYSKAIIPIDRLSIFIHGSFIPADVIEAIMKYSFVKSPYPVVLSIENHCCLEQQKIMAKIMVSAARSTNNALCDALRVFRGKCSGRLSPCR